MAQTKIRPVPSEWMDKLFIELDMMYSGKFLKQFGSPDAVRDHKAYWAEKMARINPMFIRPALDRLPDVHPDWPPTLAQFLALCTPDYKEAFQEAQAHTIRSFNNPEYLPDWSSPFIYWAAYRFGQMELQSAAYERSASRWKECLDREYARGDTIPPVPQKQPDCLALPAVGKTTLTHEESRARLGKLVQQMRSKMVVNADEAPEEKEPQTTPEQMAEARQRVRQQIEDLMRSEDPAKRRLGAQLADKAGFKFVEAIA